MATPATAPGSQKGKKTQGEVDKGGKNKVGRPRDEAQEMRTFVFEQCWDPYERMRAGVAAPEEGTSGALFGKVAIAFVAEFGWNDPWPDVKEELEDPEESGGSKKGGGENVGEKDVGEKDVGEKDGGEKDVGEKDVGEKDGGEKDGGEKDERKKMSIGEVEKAIKEAKKLVELKGVAAVDQAAVQEATRRDEFILKVRAKVKYWLEYEHRCRLAAGTLIHVPKKKVKGRGGQASKSAGTPAPSGAGIASEEVGARTQTGADILRMFLSKAPKRLQAHICWMDGLEGEAEAEFDAAVSERWEAESEKAKSEGKAPPPRQGVKHALASERYKALGEAEQAGVRKEVEVAHKKALAKWQERQSVEPESPEDAVEFLEAARDLLADLADFVAARGSAACVWYTCGPKGKAYCSSATVEVKGCTTKHWKDEAPQAYAQVGLSIAAHATAVNDARWGSLLQDLGPPTPRPDGQDDEPPMMQDMGPGTPGPEVQVDEATTSASAGSAPKLLDPDAQGEQPTGGASRGSAPVPPHVPPRVRPTPTRPPSERAQPKRLGGKASETEDALATAAASAAKAGAKDHSHDHTAAPRSPNSTGSPASGAAEAGAGAQPAPGAATAHSTTKTDQTASVFAYEVPNSPGGYATHAERYELELTEGMEKLKARKGWLDRTNMNGFFLDLKKKMDGTVNVGLACKVVAAYLDLENSNAPDERFLMRANEDGVLLPEYMAGFMRSPRNGIARWHKVSVDEKKKRTAATIDFAVAQTLPRQWAMLQPDERRGQAGELIAQADASLTWPANTICPGEEGIRILVVTLLSWGSCIDAMNSGEVTEWTRMAADVANVLDIVAARAGPAAKLAEGRKKIPTLKERERTQR